MEKQTLYLVDGHSVVYRYFYAFESSPLVNSRGVNTSGAWGMAKILITLLKHYPATHIAVIFDPPYRTWRKDFYSEYKANRVHKDEINSHLDMAYRMVQAWNIFTGAYKPLEADDVIGILTKKAEAVGMDTVIVSKDKDFAQLVSPTVHLLDLGKSVGQDASTIIDEGGVELKWGVRPGQIVDYLTIIGDTSDNVPGIKGVGKKGAVSLLKKYGSLDEIYKNMESLKPGQKKAFEGSKSTVERDRTLIRLRLDYGVQVEIPDLKRPVLHNPGLVDMFEELEFYTLLKEFADE